MNETAIGECVYLLYCTSGHYKIGRTTRLGTRIAQIRTGAPLPIKLIHYFSCSNSREVEASLHKQFASKRAQGEWFLLTPRDVEIICALPDPTPEEAFEEEKGVALARAEYVDYWIDNNTPLWGAL